MDNKLAQPKEGSRPSDLLLIPLVIAGLVLTSILIRFDFLKQRR